MPRTTHRVDDLTISVPADPAMIHGVRDRFAAWLEAWLGRADLHYDLLVVLSELLANGIAAAPDDDAEAELSVRAYRTGDDVVLEVSNPVAPWVDAATRWDLHDPLRAGGRGLLIVRALVDDVEVVQDLVDRQTTLRCRRSVRSG